MILFKDYGTQKKSITVTCLVLTFFLACASVVVNLWLMICGQEPHPSVIWAAAGLCSPFVALYWNKRLRASATGLELLSEGNNHDTIGTNLDNPE